MGVTARRMLNTGSFGSGAQNVEQKRGSAMVDQELFIQNSNFNLQNLDIKNDDLIILIKIYQIYFHR